MKNGTQLAKLSFGLYAANGSRLLARAEEERQARWTIDSQLPCID